MVIVRGILLCCLFDLDQIDVRARRFRPARIVFSLRRAASARRFLLVRTFSRLVPRRPPDVSAPVRFSRFVARFLPDAPVGPAGFRLCFALLVRRLFPSVSSPILSRIALSALTILSLFRWVLLYSTNNFALGVLLGKPSH